MLIDTSAVPMSKQACLFLLCPKNVHNIQSKCLLWLISFPRLEAKSCLQLWFQSGVNADMKIRVSRKSRPVASVKISTALRTCMFLQKPFQLLFVGRRPRVVWSVCVLLTFHLQLHSLESSSVLSFLYGTPVDALVTRWHVTDGHVQASLCLSLDERPARLLDAHRDFLFAHIDVVVLECVSWIIARDGGSNCSIGSLRKWRLAGE